MRHIAGMSDRLDVLIYKKGFSTQSLSKKIKANPSSVYNWRTDVSAPLPLYVAKLSEALGVSSEYILFGDEKLNDVIALLNSYKAKGVNSEECAFNAGIAVSIDIVEKWYKQRQCIGRMLRK